MGARRGDSPANLSDTNQTGNTLALYPCILATPVLRDAHRKIPREARRKPMSLHCYGSKSSQVAPNGQDHCT